MGGDTTKTVPTARGPIETSALGKTLMHEHVFVLSPEIQQNWPEVWGDEEFRVADAVRRLTELKEAGIDTIVDPTAIGLGRYIPRVKRIAEQLELNIIVATGLYTFDTMPFFFGSRPPGSGPDGSDPMVDMFIKDIREGIAGTGIKAGIIKCATDAPGLTPDVERVLRACAQTHRATGVPLTTHTNAAYRRIYPLTEINCFFSIIVKIKSFFTVSTGGAYAISTQAGRYTILCPPLFGGSF